MEEEHTATTEESLRERVERDAQALRRAHRSMMASFYITLCAIVVVFVGIISVTANSTPTQDFRVGLVVLMLVVVTFAGVAATSHFLRQGNDAAIRLVSESGLEVVGPFCDLLSLADDSLRSGVVTVLTGLLPRLKASDAHRLGERQWAVLLRALDMDKAKQDGEFILAILKAVEQVGTVQAVPYVEHLAGADVRKQSQKLVKEAAAECLPYLKARTLREEQSNKLLRVASADETALLRPADSGAAAPARLLRSAED